MWHCMWGRGLRETNAACSALCGLSVTSSATTSNLGPSGADSLLGGFVYILGSCGSLQWTLLWDWEFLLLPQPTQVFSVRVLRFYFPMLEPWVTGSALFLSCSSQFILMQMWDRPLCQPSPCHMSSLPWLPVSAPPTGLDECFFFNSLVVALPYSSIFWQFWLIFVFKFVVVLLWVVRGGKVTYASILARS